MSNTKTTKRALLSSVIAMFICVAMLIGTTFAWFTDSASTAVNKIQAGTLGIQLLDNEGNSLEGQALSWQKAAGAANEDVLWEPGCTYNTQQFYIENNGNLNLKFKFLVSGITGDAKLVEAIDFTAMADASWFKFNTGAVSIATSGEFDLLKGYDLDTLFYGTMHFDEYVLEPGDKVGPIVISGHMKEEAGNEYQGLSIDGIGITVIATQATGEEDSYDGTYDEDAEYPVVDANELKTALAAGGVVAIDNDITADATKTAVADRITVNAPTNLNLDAKFIVPGELEPTDNWAGLYITADTVFNATENGGIQCLDKANGECGTYVAHIKDGANVTVNSGTYYGGGTIFNVQLGTLTINGGHFEVTSFAAPYNYDFMLNCVDANYRNGTAKIIVKGGTFVNFDPSNNSAEGAGTNFVADGYTVVSETQSNGDIWYTVVPA